MVSIFQEHEAMQQYPINQQIKLMFSDAFSFISANLRQMASLCLPILLATNVISYTLARFHGSTFNAFFVPLVFNLLVYPIYTAALIQLMVAKARRENPTNSVLLAGAMRKWAELFLLKLIMVLMIMAGSILILPGIWLWVRLSFAEFYLVVFNIKPVEALQKSISDTKPYGFLILLILILTYLPILMMDLVVDRLLARLNQSMFLSMISSTFFSFLALFVLVVIFRVFMEWVNRDKPGNPDITV